MRVSRFILRKSIKLASLLIAVSVVSFWLANASPVDPVQAYIGADMMLVGADQREEIAERWGLEATPVEQYVSWAQLLIQGDFGNSMIHRQPVIDVISERFLASLALMGAAWLFSGMFGFILGSIAGMKEGTWTDRIIKWYCLTLASTPTFWLALLLLIVFSVWLGWFPVGMGVPQGVLEVDVTFADRIRHLILPALALSILGVANVALHTRQKLVDVMTSDYILFARAKGESGLTLYFRHGIRNISLPAVSLHFASFGELFGGAILAEQVFSYPGLGQATVAAGLQGDVPLLLGIVLFTTVFVFVGNLIADLIYTIVDPRIKEGRIV
ncbi:Oligopeptide ABC transporter subunit, AppB/OppB [Salisediminibacterium beveridgei]|uniref:Oligopeptide ABC transporter subunit, AppB/OppB n=1 Tax=Salisediminibacterium beveridgei TaxID=632773 RepID=A0A1D7QXD0_9BACI|nr:Oligopeptide ABC transporter subunit, AppB/OppB [Salisediminibacterium beveridgei]